MAINIFKCTRCEKDFKAPNFLCADGKKHVVEPKDYFAAYSDLTQVVTHDRTVPLTNGTNEKIIGRAVQFNRGSYKTSDPEEQIALDEQTAAGGLITREQWTERYISKEERLLQRERELANRERAVREGENALLAQVQAEAKTEKK